MALDETPAHEDVGSVAIRAAASPRVFPARGIFQVEDNPLFRIHNGQTPLEAAGFSYRFADGVHSALEIMRNRLFAPPSILLVSAELPATHRNGVDLVETLSNQGSLLTPKELIHGAEDLSSRAIAFLYVHPISNMDAEATKRLRLQITNAVLSGKAFGVILKSLKGPALADHLAPFRLNFEVGPSAQAELAPIFRETRSALAHVLRATPDQLEAFDEGIARLFDTRS